MNYTVVKFEECPAESWEHWVSQIPEASYLHSAMFLRFLHSLMPVEHRLSFVCLNDDGKPLALCPLGVCDVRTEDGAYREASWNGAPLGGPAFYEDAPSTRRRVMQQIYEQYHARIRAHHGQRVWVRQHPLSQRVMAGAYPVGQFEILSQGYLCAPQNTLVVDLRQSEGQLIRNLHQSQRKHLARAARQGLTIRAYVGSHEDAAHAFTEYQAAHANAAGRVTRPLASFEIMRRLMEEERATLFVAFADGMPLSYLFCGEFHRMAFGWSQANIDEHEKQYSPRHVLEWQAMLTYRRRGFFFYELGTRWFGPQPFQVPTKKESSIAEFKDRYGGALMADLYFERIFDRALLEQLSSQRLARFVDAAFEPSTARHRTPATDDQHHLEEAR